MKNRFSLALLSIFFTVSVLADLKDDLYGENEAHKTYFDSFVMNCSQRTPQCVERENASEKEESFNQIFINALDRDIQEWPNNELSKFRLALQTRENADSDFASGFFGNAAELYQDAFEQIAKLLDDADIIVAENIEIGEEYLYDEERPDWAVDYFNEALIYDPTNPKITKALSRIRFLQSFEDDVKDIENMINTRSFSEAELLIDELLQGDPGNKTLLALRKNATEGEMGIKINDMLLDFQDEQSVSDTELQKEELLSKIDNSLSLYGYNEMTGGIQELKATIEEDLFNERFDSLENNFINNSLPVEDLFDKSQKLLNQYPRKQNVINLSEQIKQKRNTEILDILQDQAVTLTLGEKWEDASKAYSEIYLITNEDSDKELRDSTRTITKRLSSLKQITDEPTKSLNTQDKVDSAKWLLKELKKFSNSDAPILNASIIDFEQLIDTYQGLITEDANRKKNSSQRIASTNNQRSSSTNNQRSSSTRSSSTNSQRSSSIASSTKPSSSASTSNAGSPTSSGKLDMASFVANVLCTKRTRNKQMSTRFEITVLSSGKASNVKLLNGDELNLNSRDREAIDVVRTALRGSKYMAAKSGNIAVSSTIVKKLNIPKNFCS
tara:strand:- start:375 stop:2216 length:1842 start_codon:yes stop_codon:yes gene_type:complete